MSNPARPVSCTTQWINFTALGFLLTTLFFFWPHGWTWEQQACLTMGLVMVPVVLLETLKRIREGAWPKMVHPVNWELAVRKYVAWIVTFFIIGILYWLFPQYHNLQYGHLYLTALAILPWLLPVALLYFLYMGRIHGNEPDGYSEVACLLEGDFKNRRWDLLKEYALGWTVKAFFLPLMFMFVIQNLSSQPQLQLNFGVDFFGTYFYLMNLAYFVDVAFAAAGYAMTIRLFDSHIRSTEPTMIGWVVALTCYQPFWNMVHDNYLNYDWNGNWVSVMANTPLIQIAWGSTIFLLIFLYSWGTVSFGVRFSNLTWRGLIAHGPYAITKHPAYLFKNLSWWMIAIPFAMNGTWMEALRLCLLLAGVNFIYFMRALTEERHLCQYPEYRNYCAWMSERGPLRFLPFPKSHWKNYRA